MEEPKAGSDPRAAPRLIVPMSLQLIIPRRVALQQGSPPLHQPSVILKEKRKFEKEKPWNGKCANSKLSQRRGSPQASVAVLWLFCALTISLGSSILAVATFTTSVSMMLVVAGAVAHRKDHLFLA